MAKVTYYVALPFFRTEEGDIAGGQPQECQDAGRAVRVASSFAAQPDHCGAIAFSRTGDLAIGEFDEAVVIRVFGEVDQMALAG